VQHPWLRRQLRVLPQHLTMKYHMTMCPILGKSNAGLMFGNLGGQR
jgi:hypothetical protein